MKPQNDTELAEAISEIIQSASKLNRLMAEGMLMEVLNILNRIERQAYVAKLIIVDIADLAG